jgi:hypothetical protein
VRFDDRMKSRRFWKCTARVPTVRELKGYPAETSGRTNTFWFFAMPDEIELTNPTNLAVVSGARY